jgi:hypothetical protein
MAAASETRVFKSSEGRLYTAVLRAVSQLGYSIKHSDSNARVVSFNTGISMRSWAGQDISVSVVPGSETGTSGVTMGGTRAQLAGSFGSTPQIYDWGEKGKIYRKFLSALEKVLPDIPEPTPPQTAIATHPGPFEPDGIYAGIPYKVLDPHGIDAMMPGGLVRFRNMEQFIAAAKGQTSE